MTRKRIWLTLWLTCIIGTLAFLPYYWYLTETVFRITQLFASVIEGLFIWGGICWLSYLLLCRVDLSPFVYNNFLKQVIYPGILSGILLGFSLFILANTFFSNTVFSSKVPPRWAGALASIYGGINEEVLTRLFFLTLVYFLFIRLFKNHKQYRLHLQWAAIGIAAIAFGIAHLPCAFSIIPQLSGFEIFRILFGNGIAGIVFGWLYCTKGFWTAAVSHFVTDLMIHVFL